MDPSLLANQSFDNNVYLSRILEPSAYVKNGLVDTWNQALGSRIWETEAELDIVMYQRIDLNMKKGQLRLYFWWYCIHALWMRNYVD